MNLANIAPDSNVSWREAGDFHWLVTVDGDTRTITQEGPAKFIAWIGCRDAHWYFDGALKACIDDVRYQAFLRDHPAAPAPVMGAEEIALLEYSDATDASERLARARMEQVS